MIGSVVSLCIELENVVYRSPSVGVRGLMLFESRRIAKPYKSVL